MIHLSRISQGQLNLIENCPRKFQHLYMDQFGVQVSPEAQQKLDWGKKFHRLMQQYQLGLPIELLSPVDPEMVKAVRRFWDKAPERLTALFSNPKTFRQAEQKRSLIFAENYLLIVIYDLFIADSQHAQIFDWKTYRQPRSAAELEQNWQTRLYLYVLVETSEYLPEQVSMTYWFVPPQSDEPPTFLTFPYDRAKHAQTEVELTQRLMQLSHWKHEYEHYGQLLPQCAVTMGHCQSCQFAIRCHRHPDPEQSPVLTPSPLTLDPLAGIPEIPI